MRILVLENEPSSARGGQERSLYDVCRGLASRGHEIDLLYTREGDLLDEYRGFARRTDRVSAYAIDRSRTTRAALRLLADAWQPGRPPPDLIYANQYLDSLFARVLSVRFRRPFVCHLRLQPPDRFCGQYRWGLGGAARMIAISNATKKDYVEEGFDAGLIDVVYNGIDVDEWHCPLSQAEARAVLGLPRDRFLVAYAGRLHPAKGVDVIIDALAMLPERWHAAIAGQAVVDGSGGQYAAELRQRAEAAGVTGRCQFLGRVGDVRVLYRAADLTVVPSVWSEAFGRAIVESMACGTPVVGSRAGGIPEVLEGEFARGLCDRGNARALMERLLTVMDWRASDPGLSERCREYVAIRFSIRQTLADIEAVLSDVVGKATRGAGVRPAARVAEPRTGA